jgi:tetratricopeptide (TPR) repeat protein
MWVGEHDVLATLVDTAVLQHDEAGIRQYAPQAEELAMRYGHTHYQAIAHRAWGVAHRLAGEYAEAETRLKQALDLFNPLNTRWQIGRTLFELGELAAAQTNTAQAHDYFARALTAFEEMRAAPDMARTRAALEALL